ncbi:branched-chain amino acid ABC transporter permease [Ferruginivarius sediminum]|uniref:branched-chain amino acid ABC transporter permease n=1 Tax=Ferruginivarius sediminum TaxID=2661937 RepID=UPI00187BB236|nr:branched-chain amino acid ABC transporter permease [Ferruginivarius sediminum]
MGGILEYAVFSLSLVGIYGILTLGLNVQWGMTGLFNIGVAAFFAIGAYTSGILTTPPTDAHLGGFALPIPVGMVGAIVVSGIMAFFVGIITLKLRADYLAIATIGIAEIVRLALKNETEITGGVRGMPGIPRPFDEMLGGQYELAFLIMLLILLGVLFIGLEKARTSAWGRVLRGIRENEDTTLAAGKDVVNFRLQAFVLGCCVMGFAGALYAHFISFISPDAFKPMLATFLVWVMLIAGGSGNNKGALLGAVAIWAIWSGTEIITGMLPADLTTRAGALRVLLIGVLLEVILVTRPEGLLSEAGERMRMIRREARRDKLAEDRGASGARSSAGE